jgi:hypothetical protein
MDKGTAQPLSHGSNFGIPEPRCEIAAERHETMVAIADSPAFTHIAEYLEHAKALGFDAYDLDILRRATAAGVAARARQAAHNDDPWAFATNSPTDADAARHEPVVYYARLDSLVKIGTSTCVLKRVEQLGVQGLLAVEPGDSVKEHRRHIEFQHLRLSGEWFRQAPDLAGHIAQVRDDFCHTVGLTTEAWLDQQRTRLSNSRSRNLRKVNRPLYSDVTTSLPPIAATETLVTGAEAARARGISPQLLNGWREAGKIQQAGVGPSGHPLYRLSDVVRLDTQMRQSPHSNRHQ